MILKDLAALARPWQWSKNGILFAGLVFSGHLFDAAYLSRSFLGVLVFCIASSLIYTVNDIFDLERDRVHPEKQNRPLASGRVSKAIAILFSVLLFALSVAGASTLGRSFLLTLGVFLVLNGAYSLALKQVVILDVMMIALSFVTRAVAGVMALRQVDPNLELSPWLLICTLFLALFLGFGKRRHELRLLAGEASGHRETLGRYSSAFLDQLMVIVSSATLIAYAIYTVAPDTVAKFNSTHLVWTVPFVTFGIFRYLYLIHQRESGGNPSRTLYRDLPLFFSILGWLAAVGIIVYAGRF